MKTKFLALTFAAAIAASLPAAPVPMGTAFTYQGKLNDGGVPATGLYDFNFTLFDGPVSPPAVQVGSGYSTNAVGVTNGLFTVKLDFGANVFLGDARWLNIQVKTNSNISTFADLPPRQELTPTPYAIFAGTAATVTNQAITTLQLAPNAVTGPAIANGHVVRSLNGLTDNLTLAAGPNIALGILGNTITISNTAGGGGGPAWLLGGNGGTTPGANFLGTTDPNGLEIKVNNQRALRIDPTAGAPNLTGGSGANFIDAAGVRGGVIGGGDTNRIISGAWMASIGGGFGNQVGALFSSLGGGNLNQISSAGVYSAISGGNHNFLGGPSGFRGAGTSNNIYSGAYNYLGGGSQNYVGTNDYAVLVGGDRNTSSRSWSFLGGGQLNANAARWAFLGGGANNMVYGDYSVLNGGTANSAGGSGSVVGGGIGNSAGGNYSLIAGGLTNSAYADQSTVGGGRDNAASSVGATVAGGENNAASGQDSAVAGGQNNVAQGSASFVGGGQNNALDNQCNNSSVLGGYANGLVNSYYSSVLGGFQNSVVTKGLVADNSAVVSGISNTNYGNTSAILSGKLNQITNASYAVILGGQGVVADKHGQVAFGSRFATNGDCQASFYHLHGLSGNSTTDIYLDGISQLLKISTNSAWSFHASIVAKTIGSAGGYGAFEVTGFVVNDSGTVIVQYSIPATFGSGGYTITPTADSAAQALRIKVNSAPWSGFTRWSATIRTAEVNAPGGGPI